MLTATTKSLIFISFILAFAVALQDGDQIAFKTHASPFNAQLQYLNAGTVDGSVGMAANTDYNSASGTWWKAHKLSDGSWAFESLGSIHNAQYIYLDANTYNGVVGLKSTTDYPFTGTHWSLQTLSDGTVALQTMSEHANPSFVYLDVNVNTGGSIGMKSTTNYPFTGTHWEIVTLVAASSSGSTTGSQPASPANPPALANGPGISSAESQLVDFIKSNAAQITSQPSVDINYCLQQLDPTTVDAFGPIMDVIIQAGCTNGLSSCNLGYFDGVFVQLEGSGTDPTLIEKLYILIGNMIGSVAGAAACDGVQICETIGGKIGSALTCFAISKQVYDGMVTAVSTLHNVANQVGDIGQDAVNSITNAANTAQNGVQSAVNQLNQGGDALSPLKSFTNQVAQSFTNIGGQIVGGLTTAGGAIASGATTAGGAIAGGATTAGGAIAGGATSAGGAIAGGATSAGGAIAHGFCGLFGC